MKRLPSHVKSLRERLVNHSDCSGRYLWGAKASIFLGDLLGGTSLGGRVGELSGRSVLLSTRDQLASALALIELDGVARRVIICPPDLSPEHLGSVISLACIDAIVSDREILSEGALDV